MKTTPEFTNAEIQDAMDFKQILALTQAAHRRSKKIVRRLVTGVLVTGLVGGAFFVYKRYSLPEVSAPSQIPASIAPEASVPLDTTRQLAPPQRTEDPMKKAAQEPLTGEKKKETASAIRVDSAKSAFLPAEPADGYPALYDYFVRELRYPQQAIKDSIKGVILVSFVINAQGAPEQVGTDHSLGEAFEREAIRLIEHMPAWKPAQLDGLPVSSRVSVPITFTVKTTKTQRQR